MNAQSTFNKNAIFNPDQISNIQQACEVDDHYMRVQKAFLSDAADGVVSQAAQLDRWFAVMKLPSFAPFYRKAIAAKDYIKIYENNMQTQLAAYQIKNLIEQESV